MPRLKKSVSLGKLPFGALTGIQLRDRGQEAFGIGWVAKQLRRLLKRFKVLQGEHDHGLLTVSGDDQGFVVVAHAIHGASQVGSG